jgi:DNA polymerase III subunit epsilon
MLVLGVDLETSGLSSEKDQIIEIGAVLWDTDSHAPKKIFNELIYYDNLDLPKEVQSITGITPQDLKKYGLLLNDCLKKLNELVQEAEYLVGHNAVSFDAEFLNQAYMMYQMPKIKKPWIDTLTDIPYPQEIKTRKLSYLAAEHGFINPFSHRALFDVLTTLKLLAKYDIQEVISIQQSPLVKVLAHVSFDERDKARRIGFRWDPQQRHWFSEVKQAMIPRMDYPFEYSIED